MDFEWVTSRPEHPKVAMDGSKGLQLEIAAHVVLYVGLDVVRFPNSLGTQEGRGT